MTNTTSDFGRELDSLADVISFGIAPAILAFAWGVQFLDPSIDPGIREMCIAPDTSSPSCSCCAAPRAWRASTCRRIDSQKPAPRPKVFRRPGDPAGAGMIASVVYASGSTPIHYWPIAVLWLALQAVLSFLMVSTWRYYAFKGMNLRRPFSYLMVIGLGSLIYLIYYFSQTVLLALAIAYVMSGILIRIAACCGVICVPRPA